MTMDSMLVGRGRMIVAAVASLVVGAACVVAVAAGEHDKARTVAVAKQPGGPDRIKRMADGAQIKSDAPSMLGAPVVRVVDGNVPDDASVTRLSNWVAEECADGPQRCHPALSYAGWALSPWGFAVYETGEIVSRDGSQVWTPSL